METGRISGAVDTAALAAKRLVMVGAGAMAGFARDLVRCGLGAIDVFDKDRVGPENVCRQEHMADQVGMPKAEALAAELLRINPELKVRAFHRDITEVTDDEARLLFAGADAFAAGTDSHAAQARVNQFALLLNRPGVWSGVYRGGRGGDVYFWHPGLASCYRCMFPSRYAAFERGRGDPPSDGATVMDAKLLDAVAAQVAIGLLTTGADNRFGRLIAGLGDRQVLQMKIDPDWSIGGSDPVRKYLRVPEGSDGYFAFCTVARRDPEPGGACPDCRKYRPS